MSLRRHAALLAVYEAKAGARGEAVARARNSIEDFAGGGDGELFRLKHVEGEYAAAAAKVKRDSRVSCVYSLQLHAVCFIRATENITAVGPKIERRDLAPLWPPF